MPDTEVPDTRSESLSVNERSPFASLVELHEHDALPLAEKHLAVDHRDRYWRLTDHQLPDMRMAVDELILLEVLGTDRMIVVFVVDPFGNSLLDVAAVVVQESRLRLIDDDGRRRVRGVDRDVSVSHVASSHDGANQGR